MIQSPSLSVLSLIPAAGDMPMPALPEGAELADFGALLAQSIAPAAAPIEGETSALPTIEIPAAPLADPATGGKSLPVGLPLAVPVMDPERPVAKTSTDAPDPADLPPVVPLPLAKSVIPVQPPRDEGKDKVLPAPDFLPKGELAAIAPIVVEPTLALPHSVAPTVVPAQPHSVAPTLVPVQALPTSLPTESDQGETEALPRRGPAPQPAAAALEHAAPQAAFLRQVFPARRRGPEQSAPLTPQAAQPVTPQPAAGPLQPIAKVRIEVAPTVPVMRALPKEEVRLVPSVLPTELPATPVSTSAPVASTAPVPLAHQPMPLTERPQDFSALIDRLVAAREAAGPQAVAVSVAHADFGQIHLRFRQDDAGLSVAMASADPAFARAASAMPPLLAVSDAQSGQLQNGQRHDSSAATGQSGTGQQRGSTGERQSDQSHGSPAQRQTHPDQSGPTRPQRRAGIFA